MAYSHPHAESSYQLIALKDGKFAVEVTIPEREPTKVTGFATQVAAEAWIERHKQQVTSGTIYRRGSWRVGRRR